MNEKQRGAEGFKIVPDSLNLSPVFIEEEDGSHLTALYRELEARTVDVISLSHGIDLWVDDEGLLVSEPQINVFMEYLIAALTGGRLTQRLVGTGVFLATNEEGNTVSLNPEQVSALNEAKDLAVQWFAEHRDIYTDGAETLTAPDPQSVFKEWEEK
jgi:hypothetical protein